MTGEVPPNVCALLPRAAAERSRVLPPEWRGDVLSAATIDEHDVYLIDEIQRLTGCRIIPMPAVPTTSSRALTAPTEAALLCKSGGSPGICAPRITSSCSIAVSPP
ncbi:MAG: hypothetical protein HY320_06260 [Armatimonadetes bacterium]|nr:hypothetical protein [Armatimonadota bacterium]